MDQKCRFCLKNFNKNEVYFGITEEIKENFESLAQIKFVLSTTKKNLICELCMRSLQIASLLKNQFITNQTQFLAQDDQMKVENSIQIANIAATSSKILPNPVNNDDEPEEVPAVQNIKIVKINPVMKIEKPIKQDPVPKLEFAKRYSISQTSNKIVDKILLKFEKIEQSSAVKTSILGTSNTSKTIKKSNRKKKLTTKAIESINQEDQDFKCPFCADIFASKTPLHAHVMSDHKSEILHCNVCSKSFFNQLELNIHIHELHPKERNHVCSMCPKAYTTKNGLSRHISVKHPSSKYRCEYNLCLETFDTFDAIRSHMVTVHPEVKFRDMFGIIRKVESNLNLQLAILNKI